MTAYAKTLADRFAAEMRAFRSRLTRLEQKTAGIDSGMPVALLPGIINPAYTSGDPKVLVNGSATLSGPFQHLASYTPAANDAVLLAPLPVTAGQGTGTYVVLGRLT